MSDTVDASNIFEKFNKEVSRRYKSKIKEDKEIKLIRDAFTDDIFIKYAYDAFCKKINETIRDFRPSNNDLYKYSNNIDIKIDTIKLSIISDILTQVDSFYRSWIIIELYKINILFDILNKYIDFSKLGLDDNIFIDKFIDRTIKNIIFFESKSWGTTYINVYPKYKKLIKDNVFGKLQTHYNKHGYRLDINYCRGDMVKYSLYIKKNEENNIQK